MFPSSAPCSPYRPRQRDTDVPQWSTPLPLRQRGSKSYFCCDRAKPLQIQVVVVLEAIIGRTLEQSLVEVLQEEVICFFIMIMVIVIMLWWQCCDTVVKSCCWGAPRRGEMLYLMTMVIVTMPHVKKYIIKYQRILLKMIKSMVVQ